MDHQPLALNHLRLARSLFDAGDDVRNHMVITDRGRSYLAYLRDVERADGD